MEFTSGASWVAAALAALAAALLVDGPPRQQRVLAQGRGGGDASGRWWPGSLTDHTEGGRGGQESNTAWRSAPPIARWPRFGAAFSLGVAVLVPGWSSGLPMWLVAGAAVLLGAAAVVLLGQLEPGAQRRRRAALERQTPAGLELLAACLLAGLPPRQAVEAVAEAGAPPLSDDLRVVLAAVEVGLSDAQAWRLLGNHPTLGPAAIDLARTVDSGTMLVDALLHHAHLARRRRQGTVEVAAKSVGVRCVLPMMMCFIPSFLLLGVVPTVVSAFLAALPEILGR
jgi:Flp pilus assembly protein TadB